MSNAGSAGQPYLLRRSPRARRARLSVDERGQATVVLPLRASRGVADQLVATHAGWLDRQRRRIGLEQAALAARPSLDGGRRLLVEDISYVLVLERLTDGRRSSVVAGRGAEGDRLIVRLAASDGRLPADVLEAWLRRRARLVIGSHVERHALQMGIHPRGLAIRDQRTRWASASARGVLSFNWRLLLCPLWVLDYVVVHELAHLRVAGHGRAFWQLVEAHLPPASAPGARRWLRQNRQSVLRALD